MSFNKTPGRFFSDASVPEVPQMAMLSHDRSHRRTPGHAALRRLRALVEALEPRNLFSDGPVLNYKLDDTPTFGFQTVRDSVGGTSGAVVQTGYNTPGGTATSSYLASGSFPSLVAGARGNAWSFPRGGAPTHIEVKNNNPVTRSLGNTATTTGLTLGFWVNSAYNAATDAQTRLFSFAGVFDVWATNAANGAGQVNVQFGSNQVSRLTTRTGGVLDGTWRHVVLSADFTQTTNNVRLYVDGVLDPTNGVSSRTFTSFANSTDTRNNLVKIASNREGLQRFNGSLDDFVVFDRALSATEVSTLHASGSNAAPVPFAGPHANASVGKPYALLGSALDDGAPVGSTVSYSWSVVSAPVGGSASFSNPALANAFVTLSTPGAYVLRLTASDGQFSEGSNVTLTATGNVAPIVRAGSARSAVVLAPAATTATLALTGTVSDLDGAPYPNLLSRWSVVSAPNGGVVRFTDQTSPNTVATFTAAGQYILQLTTSDGDLSASDRVTIQVYPNGTGNGAVVVNAGGPRDVWMNTPTLRLQGSYWNTDNPVSAIWTLASAPSGGGVTFANGNTLTPDVTFTAPGTYVLRLTVSDTASVVASGSATAVIQVHSDAAVFGGFSAGALDHYFKTATTAQTYDFAGFAWSRFSSPDVPDQHPRLLLSGSDFTGANGLVSRLQNTTVGQLAYAQITRTLDTRLYSATATFTGVYNDLLAGNTASFSALSYNDEANFAATLAYAAFYNLVGYYQYSGPQQAPFLTAGTNAATAIAAVADIAYANIQSFNSGDWRNVNGLALYYNYLAYAYDYGWQFMNADQRNRVKRALIEGTRNQWSVGMDTVNTYQGNTSNWINNNSMYLLMNAAVVDGETWTDGVSNFTVDPDTLPRTTASLHRLYGNAGNFTDGSTFEGMGKGQIYAESMVVLARRGDYLIASTGVKHQVQRFYNASMYPWGTGFTWDEYNGGEYPVAWSPKGNDVAALKWAFPGDAPIDFVYRADLRNYQSVTGNSVPNYGYAYTMTELLNRTVLAQDFSTAGQTIDTAAAAQVSSVPLSFFSNRKGMLWTRSGWTSDAARLFHQPRVEQGGHSIQDRGVFSFYANGRTWVPYIGTDEDLADTSVAASVVRVNGKGPSIVPSTIVDYLDTPNATFLSADYDNPYTYTLTTNTSDPLIPLNYNTTTLHDDYGAWGELPFGTLPDWQFPNYQYQYGAGAGYSTRRWGTWLPGGMDHAYRTAGLVRGAAPYALITDDLKTAGSSLSTYQWTMPFNQTWVGQSNPETITATFSQPAANVYDAVLNDGTRSLLVRVFSPTGSVTGFSVSNTAAGSIQGKDITASMLYFTTDSAGGADFRVLLFPYLNTQGPLGGLTTTYAGNVLTISTPTGQVDRITYDDTHPDGRTRLAFDRLTNAATTVPAPASIWQGVSPTYAGTTPILSFTADNTPPAFNTAVANLDTAGRNGNGSLQRGSNGSSPAPTLVTFTNPQGLPSRAWDFSLGTNPTAYVNFPANAATLGTLGNTATTTGFTTAFWMKSDYRGTSDHGRRVLSIGNGTNNIIDFRVFGDWNRFGYFNVGVAGNTSASAVTLRPSTDGGPGSNLFNNQWRHVAAVVDTASTLNNVRLYVDGLLVQQASFTFTSAFNSSTTYANIAANPSGQQNYLGQLDEVLVYNRPLSQTELTSLMRRGAYPFAAVAPTAPSTLATAAPATPFSSATITFDRRVQGFDAADLTLTRDGTTVALTGTSLTSANSITYTFSGVGALASAAGNYRLTVRSTGTGITGHASTGAAGNALAQDAVYTWTVSAALSPTATALSGNTVRVSWAGTSQYTSYRVERSSTSATSGFVQVGSTSASNFDDTTVSEGTRYWYRMVGVAGPTQTAYSAAVEVITPLSAPTLATATQVPNQLRVSLGWRQNTLAATSTEVQRSTDNGSTWNTVATLAGNAVGHLDTVVAGVTYLYRVRVFTSATTSGWATTGAVGPIITPVAPTIASPASASPPPVTGTSTVLSVLGADLGGESLLTYTWAAQGPLPGGLSFSANGTNAAKATTATFTAPGLYTFQVTITNPAGLSVVSTVNVTVANTLSVIVTPSVTTVGPNRTVQVSAGVFNQFATNQNLPVTLTTSAGTIDTAGVLVPPTTPSTVTLTGSAGSLTGTATVVVQGLPTPAAWFRLDETSGTTVADASGNNLTGTVTGTTSYTPGLSGGALSFNGAANTSGGSVNLGTPAALDISGAITLAAWVRPGNPTFNGWQNIVGRSYNSSGPAAETVLRINNNRYEVGSFDGASYFATASIPAGDLNTWVHLVGTWDGAAWRLYRNGVQVGSSASPLGAVLPNPRNWRIGSAEANATTVNRYFQGAIDDVRIYGTSFSAADAANLFATSQGPYVTTAAAAAPGVVTGTTTALSVRAEDAAGEAGLTYTWSVLGTPPAPVAFSVNGTNAAKDTVATFAAAGSCTLRVVVRDAAGLVTASVVNVTVAATPTQITLTPASVTAGVSQTRTFTATVRDQFSAVTAAPVTFSAVRGTVSAGGVYTAPVTAGPDTVTANAGSVSASSMVTVVAAPVLVSASVNEGAVQRSMVRTVRLTFSAPVTLASGALTLTRRASGLMSQLTPPASTTDGGLTWVVNVGSGFNGGSLPDGAYTLALNPAAVTDVLGQPLAGSTQAASFHRIFGDADGDASVSTADRTQFFAAYPSVLGALNFNSAFDFEGNNAINKLDYDEFIKRQGLSISQIVSGSSTIGPFPTGGGRR